MSATEQTPPFPWPKSRPVNPAELAKRVRELAKQLAEDARYKWRVMCETESCSPTNSTSEEAKSYAEVARDGKNEWRKGHE